MNRKQPSESARLKADEVRSRLDVLNREFENAHPDRMLDWAFETFGTRAVLGTGFGPSGIYLIHRISVLKLGIPVFFLDTRLLFDKTYELKTELEEQLGISIRAILPELSVDEQAEKYGDKLWEREPDKCCHMRKVLPLQGYLADKSVWITGIRRHQSSTRAQTRIIEYDEANDVIKLNPMAAWDPDRIWAYIHEHELPYNPMHDEGYPSIGCIPCTSPVAEGEDEREGRWRGEEKIECGIHFTPDGKVERNK